MGQSKSQSPSRSQNPGRRGARAKALRRPPEKGLPRFRHQARQHWDSGLEIWQLWTLLFLIVAIWCLLPRRLFEIPPVEEGTIATRTYIADRDLSFINDAATDELRSQKEAAIPPVYDFNTNLQTERTRQLGALFQTGRDILAAELAMVDIAEDPNSAEEDEAPSAPDLFQILMDASGLKLTKVEAQWLRDREFSSEIEDRLAEVLKRVMKQGIVSDRALVLKHRATGIDVHSIPSGQQDLELDLFRYLDYPDQVRETVEQDLRGYNSRERKLLADFVVANVTPNITLNSSATLAKTKAAVDAVGALFHNAHSGEVIVRKGERVSELVALTIGAMAESRDPVRLWLAGVGHLLLLGAGLTLVWLRAGLENRRDRSRIRLFNECLILLMIHVVGVRFSFFVATAISGALQTSPWSSFQNYTYAIPFASLALLSVLLYGRNLAFVLALVFSLLVGQMAGGESTWEMTFYSLMSSVAAVFMLDQIQFKQRSVMIRVAWLVASANAIAVLTLKSLAAETTEGLTKFAVALACAIAGAFLAAAITSFAVPVFESLFSITTYIKLLELSNTNLPLLRRLALEAPGTFQHSLAVANLAKTGCEAIELDSIKVHTAALYHDIGKVYRPQYFVENQAPGQNPHDKIQPSMSALILINHVKEGLELATKHGLPQPIFDAIEQHHGTQLIKFFYNRARERCDPETDDIREDEFRYPGPKPQSKEMGILMLADGVEAASRTLVEPSRQKIRGLIRKLFDAALQDHQLDQTDLTLGDLGRVEEAFLNTLTNIYHRRVDYPGFDFNQQGKDQPANSEAELERGKKKRSGGSAKSAPLVAVVESSNQVSDLAERKAS